MSNQSKAGIDVRTLRKQLGLNQTDFWTPLGVTQSGGSRYESGRGMPKPVEKLVKLVHVDGLRNPDALAKLVKVVDRAAKALGPDSDIAEQLRKAVQDVKGGA